MRTEDLSDGKRSTARQLTQELSYTPPFDWGSLLSMFRAHQLPWLEAVDGLSYQRIVRTTAGTRWFRVDHVPKQNALRVTLPNGCDRDFEKICTAVRRMFDLDADPVVIGHAMSRDPYLAGLWTRHPGLRVARSWSGFESMVTTILGQLVSMQFGRTLTGELMKAAGTKARHPLTGEPIHLFPTAKRLLNADLALVRTTEGRRTAIRAIAELVVEGKLRWERPIPPEELRQMLLSVPGVGVWTAEYISMRGFHNNDAFPGTDYGLKQELKRHPEVNVSRVRPWRAYAATALWKTFTEVKGTPLESVV